MKSILPMFLFLTFVSCSEKKIDILKVKEKIKGKYISQKFLNDVSINKSLFGFQYLTPSLIFIKDSTYSMVSDFHDGVINNYKIKNDSTINIYYGNDESDNIYISNSNLIYENKPKDIFLKMSDNLEDTINAILFSGSYKILFDSLNIFTEKTMQFKTQGDIIGSNLFSNYSLCYDFIDNIPQEDMVIFKRDKKYLWLNWLIKGDTLFFSKYLKADEHIEADQTAKIKILTIVKNRIN